MPPNQVAPILEDAEVEPADVDEDQSKQKSQCHIDFTEKGVNRDNRRLGKSVIANLKVKCKHYYEINSSNHCIPYFLSGRNHELSALVFAAYFLQNKNPAHDKGDDEGSDEHC